MRAQHATHALQHQALQSINSNISVKGPVLADHIDAIHRRMLKVCDGEW